MYIPYSREVVQKDVVLLLNGRHPPRLCNMVQDGARWCKMVQDGERWCKMVQDGARWCKMVQDGAR